MIERPRFDLEWVLPLEPGLTTHVTLFDDERPARYTLAVGVVAVGHGAAEADLLVDLWTTLVDRKEPSEVIAFVATRTGGGPGANQSDTDELRAR